MGDPICKWRAAKAHNVVELVNDVLPHKIMSEDDFAACVDQRMPGFLHTPYQLACQLGLYVVYDGTYYPRFTSRITTDEAKSYLENIISRYYIPNPYTKRGFNKLQKPILLEKTIVEYLEAHPKQNDLEQILEVITDEEVGNFSAIKTFLSNSKFFTISNNHISLNPNYNKVMELNINRNDKKAFFEYLGSGYKNGLVPLQQILFGAPGTGKSHMIASDGQVTDDNSVRTTFHPDSDYSTFVGCYKPTMDEASGEIVYDFAPQAFTNAYVAAWKKPGVPFFLIIEEINRGNCAQIFGDIFQLLDRNDEGFSSYRITPDRDLQLFLRREFADSEIADASVKQGLKMQLPPNLHIWATMNTSDQSLFPIDSAFKRRWDWRYIPIDYTDRGHVIDCGTRKYSWADFLQKVNAQIESVTRSEDKKMGYWFAARQGQTGISTDRFVSKVVFYLWNDVFKDFADSGNSVFKDEWARFHNFFNADGSVNAVITSKFLEALSVEIRQDENSAKNIEPADNENSD